MVLKHTQGNDDLNFNVKVMITWSLIVNHLQVDSGFPEDIAHEEFSYNPELQCVRSLLL